MIEPKSQLKNVHDTRRTAKRKHPNTVCLDTNKRSNTLKTNIPKLKLIE